ARAEDEAGARLAGGPPRRGFVAARPRPVAAAVRLVLEIGGAGAAAAVRRVAADGAVAAGDRLFAAALRAAGQAAGVLLVRAQGLAAGAGEFDHGGIVRKRNGVRFGSRIVARRRAGANGVVGPANGPVEKGLNASFRRARAAATIVAVADTPWRMCTSCPPHLRRCRSSPCCTPTRRGGRRWPSWAACPTS